MHAVDTLPRLYAVGCFLVGAAAATVLLRSLLRETEPSTIGMAFVFAFVALPASWLFGSAARTRAKPRKAGQ